MTTQQQPQKQQHRRIVPYDTSRSSNNNSHSTLESNWDPWLFAISSSEHQLQNNAAINPIYLIVQAKGVKSSNVTVENAVKWSSQQSSSRNLRGSVSEPSSSSSLENKIGGNAKSLLTTPPVSSTTSTKASAKGGGGGFGFLKSGFKKAQASIERSVEQTVTAIAYRADNGKNPDLVCASLHFCGMNNDTLANGKMANAIDSCNGGGANNHGGHHHTTNTLIARGDVISDVCLSRTEWTELPSTPPSSSDDDVGIPFSIPLCVPDLSFLAQGGGDGASSVKLTMRIYLRSGATLLKAMANREYCIGESMILYSNIVQSTMTACATLLILPFTSGMLATTTTTTSTTDTAPAASLHIIATPRVKFAPPCTYGWSLAEPLLFTAAARKMFQLPLDQGYAFFGCSNSSNSQQPPLLLLANERAVESTLVLPLAVACSRLFMEASSVSRTLAANGLLKASRREILLPPAPSMSENSSNSNNVNSSQQVGSALIVEVGIVALVLLPGGGTTNPPSSTQSRDWTLDTALPLAIGSELPSIKARMSFQAPHSIFEESLSVGSCSLLDANVGAGYINGTSFSNGGAAQIQSRVTMSSRFRPSVLSMMSDDYLLPGVSGTRSDGRYVGSVRVEAKVSLLANAVENVAMTVGGMNNVEGLIELENYLERCQMTSPEQVLIPAMDVSTGLRIGTFVFLMRVTSDSIPMVPPPQPTTSPSTSSGLVSVMGLDTLVEESGLAPYVDCDVPSLDVTPGTGGPPDPGMMRRRQVATMGSFLTSRYLAYQCTVVRDGDTKIFEERYQRYYQSLLNVEDEEIGVPLFQRLAPRPFRPSHSRNEALLTGIGFNVHIQTISLNVVQNGQRPTQVGVTQSITHGAPADHVKGFGGQSSGKSKDGTNTANNSAPRGGLRKLECNRLELAKELDECVSALIAAVGDHFISRLQQVTSSGVARPSRHVPPNVPSINHYRGQVQLLLMRLHSLTWDIAVRRANCFSQALGIAVTSYMSSLSDGGPAWNNAGVWAKHGYLITFEGLLSAVGKELGMIEDASIAISMLSMVSLVLVSDDANFSTPTNQQQRIPVPHSPYVRWVCLNYLTPQGSHSKTQYRLEIGLDSNFYQSRVPDPLKNGQAVRLYPVLFQMGVDVHQWGSNAVSNFAGQIKEKPKQSGGAGVSDLDNPIDAGEIEQSGSFLDDDEDDEGGEAADDEVLYVLNVEGFRKLNAYAHAVFPAASAPQQQQQQVQLLPVHPSLVLLGEAIKTSAGKMEHSVLDRAATACQKFYGGSTVFCKSGKDRTAMQVTFKQAQFFQRFVDKKEGIRLEDTPILPEEVVAKSALMRKFGTRIPICEKNAGEPKFAFNPFQRKFMPEMLRPEQVLCTWSKPET